MIAARTAWDTAHRCQRIEHRTGAELYRLACQCAGVDQVADAQRIFTVLERAFPDPERHASDRYERTRTIFNKFGRGNSWRAPPMDSPRFRAWQQHSNTVSRLRQRFLARRLIAPEPGGYVTGLLSEAPAKLWWENYGHPLASMSHDDLALFNGADAAAA